MLVQTSKDSINYPALLSNFRVYKNIIRRSIMHASKRNYHRNAFNRNTKYEILYLDINITILE